MQRLMPLLLVLAVSIALGAGGPPSHYRLVHPWSKMKSLSDDQREQIFYIHRQALDKIKEIKAQEQKDILALLSDDQKLELVKIDEAETVARKLKSAARNNASPTTAASSSDDGGKTDNPP